MYTIYRDQREIAKVKFLDTVTYYVKIETGEDVDWEFQEKSSSKDPKEPDTYEWYDSSGVLWEFVVEEGADTL